MAFWKPPAESSPTDGSISHPVRMDDGTESLVARIQSGEEQLREQLILDSMPWIKKTVRKITRSFFVEQMDEFSIALEAFSQAIDHFKTDRQVPFFGFAQLVIERRLIDWQRRQQKDSRTLLFTDVESPEGTSYVDQVADPTSEHAQADLETAESIDYLKLRLGTFGFTLEQLTDRFPKHRDTRLLCIRIARTLAEDDTLFDRMMVDHRLPVSELSRRLEVPVKTIDRNRHSIIFIALLINSDLDVIKSYLINFEREGS